MYLKYHIGLEKGSKKHQCPECKRSKKYKRYVNFATGEYLPEIYGFCERINNCGYQNHNIGEYLKSLGTVSGRNEQSLPEILNAYNQSRNPAYNSFNHFILFLRSSFGLELADKAVQQFRIGNAKNGGTIFWQIDRYGQIRTGKIIHYNPKTGRRDKHSRPPVQWVHDLLKKKGKLNKYNLNQCLFGEHQLARDGQNEMVCIVESEKTAVILSILFPEYTWLATGGVHMLKPSILSVLYDQQIVLFPDANAYNLWKSRMPAFQEKGFSIALDHTLEKKLTDEEKKNGYDLADYLLNRGPYSGFAFTEEGFSL